MSVESSIISNIVRGGGDDALTYLLAQGITAQYFTEQRTNDAYEFLLEEWNTNGEVPSQERFERRFPNFRLVVEPDRLSALVGELRNHYAISIARERVPRITARFAMPKDQFELAPAVGELAELLEALNLALTVNEVALMSERIDAYLEALFAMDGNEVPGIPTGFVSLDAASGGWQPENFGVIGAAPKRFKTAILTWMALAAARAGYRVKVVTFEMSIKELMDRLTCFGSQVSYTHILRGTLSKNEVRRLGEFADEFKEWSGDIEIVHDVAAATTLGGLSAMVRSGERPDLLMVDGLYQMTDDSREWSNETAALTAVSRGIKRLAATQQIAIVGTTQALTSRITKSRGTEMDSLGYTRAFAQDANVVLGIDRTDMQTNQAVLKVIGARAMAGIAITITVDMDSGTIFEGGEVTLGGDDGSEYDDD